MKKLSIICFVILISCATAVNTSKETALRPSMARAWPSVRYLIIQSAPPVDVVEKTHRIDEAFLGQYPLKTALIEWPNLKPSAIKGLDKQLWSDPVKNSKGETIRLFDIAVKEYIND